jgi:cell division protein FtsB
MKIVCIVAVLMIACLLFAVMFGAVESARNDVLEFQRSAVERGYARFDSDGIKSTFVWFEKSEEKQ